MTDLTPPRRLLGLLPSRVLQISPIEILAAALTIGLLLAASGLTTDLINVPLFVPSLAASTVIIFVEPGMTGSRSWNVIAGQFVSASVGMAFALTLAGSTEVAAALTMAVALILMRVLRCLHPPALATALIIIVSPGSAHVQFLLFPVLAGSVMIVLLAWLVHLLEQRYPSRLGRSQAAVRRAGG